MKVTVKDAGPCRKLVAVDAPAEVMTSEYGNVLKAYVKSARVSGFRKGKAPADVVEQQYKKQIIEETRDRVVPELYQQALSDQSISPVAVIDVSEVDASMENGIKFSFTVDVAPDFKLPKYKKIPVKANEVTVDDKEMDEHYNRILDNFSRYEDIEGRSVKQDDLVQIDYEGTCDDKPVSELGKGAVVALGKGKDFWAVVGEPEFMPGLAEAMTGMSIGDTKEINIHFPEDYRVTDVGGMDTVYSITVKGIREKQRPELNDEFFKNFEVSSEQELKDKISKEMLDHAQNTEQTRQKEAIASYLIEKTQIDIPESLIEREKRNTLESMYQRMAMQGVTKEQLEERAEEMESTAVTTSTERIKISYILARIGEAEQIEVDDGEVNQRLKEMAARYQMEVDKLKSEMGGQKGVDGLKNDIKGEKTLNFILEQAKIKK